MTTKPLVDTATIRANVSQGKFDVQDILPLCDTVDSLREELNQKNKDIEYLLQVQKDQLARVDSLLERLDKQGEDFGNRLSEADYRCALTQQALDAARSELQDYEQHAEWLAKLSLAEAEGQEAARNNESKDANPYSDNGPEVRLHERWAVEWDRVHNEQELVKLKDAADGLIGSSDMLDWLLENGGMMPGTGYMSWTVKLGPFWELAKLLGRTNVRDE